MSEDLKYAALWQNKRGELPVDGNPSADWQGMQSLLDQHLPVTPGGSGGGSSGGAGISGAAGMGSGIIKLLAVLAITIPAAVALYFVVHSTNPKAKKQSVSKHDSIAAITLKKDSLLANQQLNDEQLTAYNDSISQVQKQVNAANITLQNLLNADNKTAAVKDSIVRLKRTLAASARVLNQLIAVRDKIAKGNKSANENSTLDSNGSASPGTTVNAGNVSSTKNNKPGDGRSSNNPNSAKPNSSTVSGKKENRLAMNTMGGNSRRLSAANGNTRAGVSGNPSANEINNNKQHNRRANLPNANHNGKINNAGNNLPDNNGGNSITSGSNPSAGVSGDNNNQQQSTNELLMAANGYHPDADVFGSIAIPGNYPFINKLRPGDMRYKLRVYPGIGSVKIDVNKPPKPKKEKKPKAAKDSSSASNLDWGLLLGANTNGSFTGKSQNANIYGSLPVDLYTGLFGTYHFNDKLGLNLQVWLLNPQNISGGYSHANGSKVDSGKIIQVTDSRKAYFVTIPVHAMYQITDNLALKFGPVINLPVKQINGITKLTPTTISKDSTYYKKTITQINATKYQQTLNFGLSGGLQFNTGRLTIEATYLKNLGGYKVSSDYGTYTASPGVLQFTVGFRLNRGR